MVNLLKADFFRVLRTKIVYISLIIAIILPIFVEGVAALTEAATRSLYPEEYVSTGVGNTYLMGSFSPIMGFSFIFAVFPVIVIMMDFGNGTIRNKFIHGYTRHQIFAAHFIITLVYAAAITTLFVITNVLGALILGIEIPSSLVTTCIIYYAIGSLNILLIASIGCGLALSLGNAGAIVLTVFTVLFFNYFGSILGLILQFNEVSNAEYILCFFPSYLTETLSSDVLYYDAVYNSELQKHELILYIEAVLGMLIISGGFYALGTFVFAKKDFK